MMENNIKYRILLIDDDIMLLKSISNVLQVLDYEPIPVGSPEEGLQVLQENDDIVLVILDWVMPGATGIETLKKINELDDPPPVIMMTAKMEKADVMKALSCGAKDYLTKPVDLNILKERINNIIKRDIEWAKRRAARRNPTAFKGNICVSVLDISETGVAIETSFPLEEGSIFFLESPDLALKIDLPRGHHFSLRVANCTGKGNKYKVGAQLIGLSNEERDELRKLCAKGKLLY